MMFPKTEELINSLISSTKQNKINWGSASDLFISNEIDNAVLKKFVLSRERSGYFYSKNHRYFSLDQYGSLYTSIESGFVYIFKYVRHNGSYYSIALQNNKYSSIVELNDQDDCQAQLIELAILAKERMDNYTDYINIIIQKLNEN